MQWLILSVFLWGTVHSLLASQGAKAWLQRRFGKSAMRFYRLTYNLFAAISFLPVLWLTAALPDRVLYRIPVPWLYLTLAGQLLAAALLLIGLLQTDTLAFLGLRQLLEGEEKNSALVVHGLYRWVRHPLYAAGLMFIWLVPVMSVNLLAVEIATTIYIIVGAYFEERKLLREYGAAYADYQASTPMLIPGLRCKRNR